MSTPAFQPKNTFCPDRNYFPRVLKLLGCMDDEFKKCHIDLCYLGPVSGTNVDASYVGEDGSMAWVRVDHVSNENSIGASNCVTTLTVYLEVGFITCTPVHEDGSPLTLDENIELTQLMFDAQTQV